LKTETNLKIEIMKTTFKLFGLKEENIIRSASLCSNGIEMETELTVTRHHLSDFYSKHEAVIFLHNANLNNAIKEFEHGFEIIEVFTK
jgi:uncharacterized Rossmann fold enzyme